MSFTIPQSEDMTGQIALDRGGEEIGTIAGVYLDDATKEPEWAAVDHGAGLALVPLAGAAATTEGVQVAFHAEEVEDAPYQQSRLSRALAEEEEAALYEYYGLRRSPGRRRRPRTRGSTRTRATRASKDAASTAADQGQVVASTAVDRGQEVASSAVDQGQQVAQAARRQAVGVAGTAREQVSQVTQELSGQARGLMDQTKSQLQDQAETQARRLAETLRRLGGQVEALAEGRPAEAGPLGDYARQGAGKLSQVAEVIESRSPDELLDDFKAFATARPGAVVMGAAVVGLAVGRLVRAGQ